MSTVDEMSQMESLMAERITTSYTNKIAEVEQERDEIRRQYEELAGQKEVKIEEKPEEKPEQPVQDEPSTQNNVKKNKRKNNKK